MAHKKKSKAPKATLDGAIRSLPVPLPDQLPPALPIAHISIARWFRTIVAGGRIVPRICKIFNRDVTYFFYGGAFYRPKNLQTTQRIELPIAFLFEPSILNDASCYYPFDTGAIAGRKYPRANRLLGAFKRRYKVKSTGTYKTPSILVHHLYGDNTQYIDGNVDRLCKKKPDPFPRLHRFLSEDLSSLGFDHRQTTIECQFDKAIDLDQKLIWIGFPESLLGEFGKLCERMAPHVPAWYHYRSHRSFNPAQVAAQLELLANDVVMRYATRPRGGR